jgi:TolA-binding protein
METRSVPTAALGALELVTAWAWRRKLAEMARVEEAETEVETAAGPETEEEAETEAELEEIEGRIERRESQERQQMLGQPQTRTNGNPIRGPIYRDTKVLRQIGSWTLSTATMFIRTMAVI